MDEYGCIIEPIIQLKSIRSSTQEWCKSDELFFTNDRYRWIQLLISKYHQVHSFCFRRTGRFDLLTFGSRAFLVVVLGPAWEGSFLLPFSRLWCRQCVFLFFLATGLCGLSLNPFSLLRHRTEPTTGTVATVHWCNIITSTSTLLTVLPNTHILWKTIKHSEPLFWWWK